MEKEINFTVENINLNYFSQDGMGERLEVLLRSSLTIFSKKAFKILKEDPKVERGVQR